MAHDHHREKFNKHYWSLDIKPKGKYKHHVHAEARAAAKEELHRELVNDPEDARRSLEFDLDEEASDNYACYLAGGCNRCRDEDEGI